MRLEAIRFKPLTLPKGIEGGIEVSSHVQSIGWQGFVQQDGKAFSGTSGSALRLEGMKVQLTGEVAKHYDVYYRVHAQTFGWLDWAKNGEASGTAGFAKRLEALEVKIVKKGSAAPGKVTRPFVDGNAVGLKFKGHVQTYGWSGYYNSRGITGTVGQGKRLEAIQLNLNGTDKANTANGGIQYKMHVQKKGWQGWSANGATAGTVGSGLRTEGIQIRLTGEAANLYDIYYRTHIQSRGWMGWAVNGQKAGSEGLAYRMEALQIVLVKKGNPAPGKVGNAFVVSVQGKGAAKLLGTTREKIINELSAHQNDRFYKGTPFRGGAFFDQTYSMSPNGNPNKYGPGMNCTGFVASVFNQVKAPIGNVTRISNRSGGVTNAYNWRDALKTTGNYYVYPSIDKFLASGKAEKGDIIYFEADFTKPFYDCHIGFYWGNHKGHNQMWHSTGRYGNATSNMFSGTPYSAVYLFKL